VVPATPSLVVSGVSLILASGPAVTVAEKVAEPAPLTDAVAVCAPATFPGVHCAVVCPLPSVVAVAGEMDPDDVPQVTPAPGTARPPASRTFATSAIGAVDPAVTVELEPLSGEMLAGGPTVGSLPPPPHPAARMEKQTTTGATN
jgi:hypothetical protein